jgi:hypothetical protein
MTLVQIYGIFAALATVRRPTPRAANPQLSGFLAIIIANYPGFWRIRATPCSLQTTKKPELFIPALCKSMS